MNKYSNLNCKKIIHLRAGGDVASGAGWRADLARRTTALMRRGTEATWQGSGWSARGAGGAEVADTWQEATRSRWSTTWQSGLADGGPTG